MMQKKLAQRTVWCCQEMFFEIIWLSAAMVFSLRTKQTVLLTRSPRFYITLPYHTAPIPYQRIMSRTKRYCPHTMRYQNKPKYTMLYHTIPGNDTLVKPYYSWSHAGSSPPSQHWSIVQIQSVSWHLRPAIVPCNSPLKVSSWDL